MNKMRLFAWLLVVALLLGIGGAALAEDEAVTLDIFINESWWPIDTFTGIIPEAITEATGVKLNVTVCTDDNQLGLMIASRDLPDLVFTQKELNRLSNSEVCYSYDELIEQYVPGYTFNDLQTAIGRSLSTDGKYYAILNAFNTADEWAESLVAPAQCCTYYREDLYEEMGSPELKTLDDLLNICEMVKEKYPDMEPFGLGGFWKLQNISMWTGASGGSSYQYLDDGSVVYQSSVPAYKDYLKFANTMARNGYFTAESYANEDEAISLGYAYAGNCFIFPWYLSPAGSLGILNAESQKINPDARWAPLPALGGDKAGFSTSRGWCGTFITKNCKDPEAAIRLMTFLFSDEGRRLSKYGREGIEYTLDETGMPHWTDEWKEAMKDPTVMNEKYNQYFYLGASSIEDQMPGYADLDEKVLAAYATYKDGYEVYPEIGIATPTTDSDEGVIEAKLTEMLPAAEAKVIFSETDEEFEANFAELQKKAEQLGVEQLNAYMTEAVAKVKVDFGF